MTTQNLLILDSRIDDLSIIIESINENTKYIILDYYVDTFQSLQNKIDLLNLQSLYHVGLLRHGYYLPYYKLIDQQNSSIVRNIQSIDPNLDSWKQIKDFINSLKTNYQIQVFDFLSCRLDIYNDYAYIFDTLQLQLEITIGATKNDLGNIKYHGSWILTNDNEDVSIVYFDNDIFVYSYLLFQPVLTIQAQSFTKTYDRILYRNTSVTYDGFVDQDSLLTLSNFVFGNIIYSGTYINAIDVSSYTIIPNGLTSNKYYIDLRVGYLYIVKANLSVEVNNYIKIYDNTNIFNDYVFNYSGYAINEDYSSITGILSLSGTFINAINVGVYSIIPLGLHSYNYNIIFETSTLTIIPASLLVIANNQSKIYDRTFYSGGNGVIYDGFMGLDNYTVLQGNLTFQGDSQGAYYVGNYTIMPSGLTSNNYNITFIGGKLIIYMDSFLIKANDFNKFYDALFFSNPNISYTGFYADLSGNLTISGSFLNNYNIGSYNINVSGLSSSNYVISYYDGTLTIVKNEVFVIANNVNKMYDGLPYLDISVYYQGLLGIDISANDNNFFGTLINVGTSYNSVNIGTYNIIPNNLNSNNYLIVYKAGTLVTSPAPLTIITQSFTKAYDGYTNIPTNSNIVIGISGIMNGEIINIVSYTSKFQNSGAGYVLIDISNITLSGFTLNNYYILPIPPVLGYISPLTLVATFSGGNKPFDGKTTTGPLLYSLSGMINNETITISDYYAQYKTRLPGTNYIDISYIVLAGLTSKSYIVAPISPLQALIYQNFLQILWVGGHKTYDGNNRAGPLTFTISGVIIGEYLTISSYSGYFRNTNAGNQYIDISYVVLWGPTAYTYIAPPNIPFYATIYKKNIIASFTGGSKIYDATFNTSLLYGTLSGIINNDIVTISSYYTRFKTTKAGNNIIDISNVIISSNNYFVLPVLSISAYIYKKTLVASFTSNPKIYDSTTITNNVVGYLSGLMDSQYLNTVYTDAVYIYIFTSFYQNSNIGNVLIDVSNIILFGPQYDNYYLQPLQSFYGIINPRPLTAIFKGGNKIYDGTTFVGPFSYGLSGIINQSINNIYTNYYENVTISSFFIQFQSPNVGNVLIDVSFITITSTNYYLLPFQSFTAFINYKTLIASFSGGYKVYDSLTNTGQVFGSLSGIIGNENITISSFTTRFKKTNVGIQIIDISNVIISGPTSFNYRLLPVLSISSYIDYKNITITFTGGYKIYDGTYNTGQLFSTISGLIGQEQVFIYTYISKFKNNNAGPQIIDISDIILFGQNSNYNLLPILSISSYIDYKIINTNFFGGNKIYDGTYNAGPMIYTISGIINSESIIISSYLPLFRQNNVGYQIIDISNIILFGPTINNYLLLPTLPISAFINYKNITATFTGGYKIYDSTLYTGPITYSLTGLIDQEYVTISTFISKFRKANAGPQIIDISFVTITSKNYYVLPVLSISSFIDYKTLIASFTGGSKIYDGTIFTSTLNNSLSGIIGQEDVQIYSFTSKFKNPNVGPQIIDISNVLINSTNYIVLPVLSISSFINYKNVKATFTGGYKIYDGSIITGPLLFTLSGMVNNEFLTICSFIYNYRIPESNVGYKIIDISDVTITSNNYFLLPVLSISSYIDYKTLIATFNGGYKIYDSLTNTGDVLGSLSGIIGDENIIITSFTTKFRKSNVGPQIIDISNVVINSNNYLVLPVLSISSYIDYKTLIATFKGGYKIYNGLTNTGNVFGSLSGIIGNENIIITSFSTQFKNPNVGSQIIDISNVLINSNNYLVLPVLSISSYIDYKNLVVSFTGGNKIYDSYRDSGFVNGSISGIVNNEYLTISYFTSFFRDQNITCTIIDISNLIIDGPTVTNYNVLPILPISAKIYSKGLYATFVGGNKIYDKTKYSGLIYYTLSGIIGEENITISSFTSLYRIVTIGQQIIDISNIILSGPTSYNYYIMSNTPISGTIIPRVTFAIFTGGQKIYDGNNIANQLTITMSNIIINDNVQIYPYFYTSFFRNINVGYQFIDISNTFLYGQDSFNYLLSNVVPCTSYISPKQLNINFSKGNKTYDGTNNVYDLSYNIIGLVQNDYITIDNYTAIFRNYNTGPNFIDISNIILLGPVYNYNIMITNTIIANIYKRFLTIIFSGGNKVYDTTLAPGVLSYIINNIVNNEDIQVVTYTSKFKNYNVGNQYIDISNVVLTGSTINNYELNPVQSIIASISKFALFINFSGGDKVYNGTNNIGSNFNIIISYIYPNAKFYILDYGGTFRNINSGVQIIDTNILYLGQDVDNYDLIITKTISANIYPKPINANFTGGSKIYNQSNNTENIIGSLVGVLGSDKVSISSFVSTFRNINVKLNIIDISNVVLTGPQSNNYSLNNVLPIQANITPKPINAIFSANDKIYDGTKTTDIIGTLSGIYQNDTLTIYSFISFYNNINIGYNKIDISNVILVGRSINNYTLLPVTPIYSNILPKALTIYFSGGNKIYDSLITPGILIYTISGIVGNDIVSISSFVALYDNPNYGYQNINFSNVIINNSNYYVYSVPSIVGLINAKPIFANFINLTKIYDGTQNITNNISGYITGILNNDIIPIISFTGSYKNYQYGPQFIDISNIIIQTISNYVLQPNQTVLGFIYQRGLTINYLGGDKIYDGGLNTSNLSYTISNVINNEIINVSSYYSQFRNINIGYQIIDISYSIISGPTVNNYFIYPVIPISSTIIPKPISIQYSGINKIYDNTNLAFVNNPTISGLVFQDIRYISISSYISLYNDKFVGYKPIYITNMIINSNNYIIIPSTSITFSNILPKQIYLSALGISKIYTKTFDASLNNVGLSGIFDSDISFVTLSSYTSNFLDYNIGMNKPILVNQIILDGIYAFNYSIFDQLFSANIYPKYIDVSFNINNKIFDKNIIAYVNTYLINSIYYNDIVNLFSYNSEFIDANVGLNKLVTINQITLSGLNSYNYLANINYTNASILIPTTMNLSITNTNIIYSDVKNYMSFTVNPIWNYVQTNILENFITFDNNYILSNYGLYNNLNKIVTSNYIFNSFTTNNNVGYIVCNSGVILSTNDSWITNTITTLNFTKSNNIKAITKIINNVVWAITSYNILQYNNNWIIYDISNVNEFNDITMIDISNISIVGNNGSLYQSYDGGVTWNLNYVSTFKLNSIFMLDYYNGLIVGNKCTIIRTNDNVNWVVNRSISGSFNLYSIYAYDVNNIITVGDNGIILKSSNRGVVWNVNTSDTVNKLSKVIMFDNNNIQIVGDQGTLLNYVVSPSGLIYFNNNIISSNQYLTNYDVNVYAFQANFVPYSITYGPCYSNILNIMIKPILYYVNNKIDTNFERSNIIYSDIPIYAQLGGIFTISSNINVSITSSGIIVINPNILVGYYSLIITYSLNNAFNTTLFYILVRPVIYYPQSTQFITFRTSNYSILPYTNPIGTKFTIFDISGSLVQNNLVTISKSGIIYFNNNINLDVYQFNIFYSYMDISNSTNFNLVVRPYFIYPNDYIQIDYNTSNNTEYPITDLSGGTFQIIGSTISGQVFIISDPNAINSGSIYLSQLIVGYYTLYINYYYNSIYSSTTYIVNASPYYIYPVINNYLNSLVNTQIIVYNNSSTANAITIPIGGNFNVNDISGDLINTNLVSMDNLGTLQFSNLIKVGYYQFLLKYTFNIAFKNIYYNLTVIPYINYSINYTTLNYDVPGDSILPVVNPTGGYFKIIATNNILDQLNLLTINYYTGQIHFFPNIYSGYYNFTIYYYYRNIYNTYNYTLNVLPNFYYVPNYLNIILDSSDNSVNPNYKPIGGTFSISGPSYFNIDSNTGILYVAKNSNLNVGIYLFNINYVANNVVNITAYTVNMLPIIYYNSSTTLLYIRSVPSYSVIPYVKQSFGTFAIYDTSANYVNSRVFIDSSGVISFYPLIYAGFYSFNVVYSLNQVSNSVYYNLLVKPNINYNIGYTESIYDNNLNVYSEYANVTPIGGVFTVQDYIGLLVNNNKVSIDSSGVINFSPFINVGSYQLLITYTLNFASNTILYNFVSRPNFYYTISSSIINYGNIGSSILPYNNQPYGSFTLSGSIGKINNYGILSFNNISVGIYNLFITYKLNNIANYTTYALMIIPNINYSISKLVLSYNDNGFSVTPITSPANGLFTITNNNYISIDQDGVIYINSGIGVGIYNLVVTYTINSAYNTFIYKLTILPYVKYLPNTLSAFYERSSILTSKIPDYQEKNGSFSIIDNFGLTVTKNLVTIDASGIIYFLNNINVGIYNYSIIYTLYGLSVTTFFTLTIQPTFYYVNPITQIRYQNIGLSNPSYYNQIGGRFSVADISGSVVGDNQLSINVYDGTMSFNNNINVGIYTLNLIYTLNGTSTTSYYFLYILPTVIYKPNYKFINYGTNDYSVPPNTSQQGGVFSITDLSNNGVFLNTVTINSFTGVIYFNSPNVGMYNFSVTCFINNVYATGYYYLNVYPTIYYPINNSTFLFNRAISYSNGPIVQQNGGRFKINDMSNNIVGYYVSIDASGIIQFKNLIFVNTYLFNITYTLNNLSNSTKYYLYIIPNINYTNLFTTVYYGNVFNSEQPYYDQSGGVFTIYDLSSDLVSFYNTTINNFGVFSMVNDVDVGLYFIGVTYTLNNLSNNTYYEIFVQPQFFYEENTINILYQTTEYTIYPIVNPPGGYFYIPDEYQGFSSLVNPYISLSGIIPKNFYVDPSNGIITLNNFVGNYIVNVIYIVNNPIYPTISFSNSATFNLNVIPIITYDDNVIIADFLTNSTSNPAFVDPSGGYFYVTPNYDLSNSMMTLVDISSQLISIASDGTLYFDGSLIPGIYSVYSNYLYNNNINHNIFNFSMRPYINYDPASITVPYHDISYSLAPLVQPYGGVFSATLALTYINYSGISINPNTGVMKFNNVNAGYWTITIKYSLNGVYKTFIYTLHILSDVFYEPPYLIAPHNTLAKSKLPFAKNVGGTYYIDYYTNITIDINKGMLTFNYLRCGVYNINVTYNIFGANTTINYTAIIEPLFSYPYTNFSFLYSQSISSIIPVVNPLGGKYTCTNNDITLSKVTPYLYIDISSGIIKNSPLLNVGVYNILVTYFIFGSQTNVPVSITVYPQINYPVGQFSKNFGIYNTSEPATVKPPNGKFSCSDPLFFVFNDGTIEFKNATNVGTYIIPIKYTYNSLYAITYYKLVVNPLLTYRVNSKTVIYTNSSQSIKPTAQQNYGEFFYASISSRVPIPVDRSFITSNDQYLYNGVILNGYSGIINFGPKVLVGNYILNVKYVLYDLSASAVYTLTVLPYINYSISSLILDYNTQAITVVPFTDQSGGYFDIALTQQIINQLSNIYINNKTGTINFFQGINVGLYNINVLYTYASITNNFMYTLTINPIYYYSISILYIVYQTSFKTDIPITIQSGGNFNIVDYNGIPTDQLSVDYFTGIVSIGIINNGTYIVTLRYTLNNSTVTTTLTINIQPLLNYYTFTTLQYSKDGYSSRPIALQPGGLFGFQDITSLTFQSSKISIDISSGVIYFGSFINVGIYSLYINYIISNIMSISKYNLSVVPLFYYSISGISLSYEHNTTTSILPTINPIKGLFYFADHSNNNVILNGVNLNQTTGQLTFNQINVGSYNIAISYYVKTTYINYQYILLLLSTFYYKNNQTILTYGDGITYYSEIPYINPLGGICQFVLPINAILFNFININDNGQIIFRNNIPVDSYSFQVYYTYNNIKSFQNYYCVIQPVFYYPQVQSIIFNTLEYSTRPITSPNNGLFSINNSNFYIDISTGIIKFDNLLSGAYSFTAFYTYNNIVSSYNYSLLVIDNVFYSISSAIINYNTQFYSIPPLVHVVGGYFTIPSYYKNISVDISSGILYFNKPIVDYYNIIITYYFSNIYDNAQYNLTILPNLSYDISSITVNYLSSYVTQPAYFSPNNGSFTINSTLYIDSSGSIYINNIDVDNYNLVVTYSVIGLYSGINLISTYNINLIVLPILDYRNTVQSIYCNNLTFSNKPIVQPINGIFTMDVSSIYINNGIISLYNNNIGYYSNIVYYTYNNIVTSYKYKYVVVPVFYYVDNNINIVGNTSYSSDLPIITPSGGIFSSNNNKISVRKNGIIDISNNLLVGNYNIIVNYNIRDISTNAIIIVNITPFVSYYDEVFNYGQINYSRKPYINCYGGIFTLSIPSKIINIDISSGVIQFASSIYVNNYFLFLIYSLNGQNYTTRFNYIVNPVLNYNNINCDHNTSLQVSPSFVNPTGGIFSSNSLPNFVSVNNSIINIASNNYVGIYNFYISYSVNNISISSLIILHINPVATYQNTTIIYNSIGLIYPNYISISGGLFYSNNSNININSNTGIVNYLQGLPVNNNNILINYLYGTISGYFNLNIKVIPFINYSIDKTLSYGDVDVSVIPTIYPAGGIFSLQTNIIGVTLDSVFGILNFAPIIRVGTYIIVVVYTYNNISNTYNFKLIVNKKSITANFVALDKVYDGTTNVIFSSNKLVGVINNDKVFINDYNSGFITSNIGINIQVYINNIILGGPDSTNYEILATSYSSGNIAYGAFNPNKTSVNYGTSGSSVIPVISTFFDNPSFLITNTILGVIIDVFGVITWSDTVKIGTYNFNIQVYNSIKQFNLSYTLIVTTNLYATPLDVNTPVLPNTIFTTSTSPLQYKATSGYSYANSSISGLVGLLNITSYNSTNNNITHDLNGPTPFNFYLPNADPNVSLIMYEENDDGTLNYSIGYKMIFVGNGYWSTNLQYLSVYAPIAVLLPPYFSLVISPNSSIQYFNQITVTINFSPTIDNIPHTIYYTLDSSIPDNTSSVYTNPLILSQNTVVKATAYVAGYKFNDIVIANYIISYLPCILSNTLIKTVKGYEIIDNLAEGDLLITDDGRVVPIINIVKYRIDEPKEDQYPVCIPKNFFSYQVPNKNTYLSENHAIHYIDFWTNGRINLNYFEKVRIKPVYYHIQLPNYFTDNIVANNMTVESWTGSNMKFCGSIFGEFKKIKFNGLDLNTYKKINYNRTLIYKNQYQDFSL
jgi:hypothetical protein